MKLEVVESQKLKKPPTSICSAFNRTYVSTKGKRLFYFPGDGSPAKSIKFTQQVNSLSTNGNMLFCSQQDGSIFGLNSNNKSTFRSSVGETKPIYTIWNDGLYIASQNNKITVLSENSLVKNTYYFTGLPIVQFALSRAGMLSVVLQNEQNIQLINTETKEKSIIKTSDGYPEAVKFIGDNLIISGSSKGNVGLFSLSTKKKLSFLKLDSAVSSISVLPNQLFLVGTIDCKISLVSVADFNKLVLVDQLTVDGIPIDFIEHNEDILCAISRESRLGRWHVSRTSHNQVIKVRISGYKH